MSRRTVGALVAVATSAALAGSGLVAASAQPPGSARAAGPRSVITGVRVVKHEVRMPGSIRAGLHTFVVRSKDADFEMLKVHGRYTKQQFVDDANVGLNGGKVWRIRRLERHVTFLGGGEAAPGRPAIIRMRVPRGRFWALDSGPRTVKAANIFVGDAGGVTKAGVPHGNGPITAVDDNKWSTSDPGTIPAAGTLLFKNASHDNHFVVFGKLLPGKTVTDFGRWVDAVNKDPKTAGEPPVDQKAPGFFNGVIGPGRSMSNNYSLPAGSYIVACFWPDADMGGMEHVFMGMYRGITLK